VTTKKKNKSSGGGNGAVLLGLGIGAVVSAPVALLLGRQRSPSQPQQLVPLGVPATIGSANDAQDLGNRAVRTFEEEEPRFENDMRRRNLFDAAWALNRLAVAGGNLNAATRRLSSDHALHARRKEMWERLADYTNQLGRAR
jgi:hypothetical protein